MDLILEGLTGALSFGIILTYVVLIIAVIAGIVVSIRRRIKEKATGEEEEAKKY